MVFVIMNSDGSRNQAGRSWWSKGIAYTAASIVAASIVGFALGQAGTRFPESLRLAGLTVAGAAVLCLGILEAFARRVPLLECNRETPQRLLASGALRGAIANGLRLGHGLSTRVGFSLWYLVPIGAFLSGGATRGAIVYGSYGLTRGLGPWALIGFTAVRSRAEPFDFQHVATSVLGGALSVRRAAGAASMVMGGLLFVVAGF